MTATVINDPAHPAASVARAVAVLARLNLFIVEPGGRGATPISTQDFIDGLQAFLPPGGLLLVGESVADDLAQGRTLTLPDGIAVRATK
jgi:hypothetical protein